MISDKPWFVSEKHPETNAHAITNGRGRVIAAMIPNTDDARLMAAAPDMWGWLVTLWNNQKVLDVLDDAALAAFQKFILDEDDQGREPWQRGS